MFSGNRELGVDKKTEPLKNLIYKLKTEKLG